MAAGGDTANKTHGDDGSHDGKTLHTPFVEAFKETPKMKEVAGIFFLQTVKSVVLRGVQMISYLEKQTSVRCIADHPCQSQWVFACPGWYDPPRKPFGEAPYQAEVQYQGRHQQPRGFIFSKKRC